MKDSTGTETRAEKFARMGPIMFFAENAPATEAEADLAIAAVCAQQSNMHSACNGVGLANSLATHYRVLTKVMSSGLVEDLRSTTDVNQHPSLSVGLTQLLHLSGLDECYGAVWRHALDFVDDGSAKYADARAAVETELRLSGEGDAGVHGG